MTSLAPKDAELAALMLGMGAQQIADAYGVAKKTVEQWISNMRVRNGQIPPGSPRRNKPSARTVSELRELADLMLDRAVKVASDDTITGARDQIAQAKLALAICEVLSARIAAAPREAPAETDAAILDRVKAATSGAARHLSLVGSGT